MYISGVKGYYSMFSLGYNSRLRELGMEKQNIELQHNRSCCQKEVVQPRNITE